MVGFFVNSDEIIVWVQKGLYFRDRCGDLVKRIAIFFVNSDEIVASVQNGFTFMIDLAIGQENCGVQAIVFAVMGVPLNVPVLELFPFWNRAVIPYVGATVAVNPSTYVARATGS